MGVGCRCRFRCIPADEAYAMKCQRFPQSLSYACHEEGTHAVVVERDSATEYLFFMSGNDSSSLAVLWWRVCHYHASRSVRADMAAHSHAYLMTIEAVLRHTDVIYVDEV